MFHVKHFQFSMVNNPESANLHNICYNLIVLKVEFSMVKSVLELQFEEAKTELQSLQRELEYHDDLYYNKAEPEISDWEYDQLRLRLNEIEAKFPELKKLNSSSQKVGAPVSGILSKITHKKPMLSLENAFSTEDLENFIERVQGFLNTSENLEFCAEHKIDGLSASIVYNNGYIVYAATRGDGYVGEDVTENIKTILDVPKRIDYASAIEIRGEVYMPIQSFTELNKQREENGKKLFANPRNAAAGSLRQLDAEVTKSRNLGFFAYYIDGADLNIATQIEVMGFLKKLGFSTAECRLCHSLTDLAKYCQDTLQKRPDLPYEIDGAVFKLNSLKLQERLGFVGRNPRHSIAYKFPAEEAETKVLDIAIGVGRTGKITPVAILEPVNLNGAMVSRATLHNFNEIERKQIAIGDTVKILRSGDVIPKIIAVTQKSGNEIFTMPKTCPSCGTELIQYPGLVDLYCPNHYGCPEQAVRYISYFVSKSCLDIPGLGEKQVEEFFAEGRIKTALDIFKLKEKEINVPLASKPGWGKVSAQKLYDAIEMRRNVSLERFVVSLGIPGVGEVIAQLLADRFKNIGSLQKAEKTDLVELDGLGDLMAEEIYEFFRNDINIRFIDEFKKLVTISYQEKNIDSNSAFYGKTIVFTGTLSRLSRNEAKQIAISRGASVASAISGKTDIVVVGENPGSKLHKATEFGVQIMTEEEFIQDIQK